MTAHRSPFKAGDIITDTSLLEPHMTLEVRGNVGLIATLAVLDSHNPSALVDRDRRGAKARRPLGPHHHLLGRLAEAEEVLPLGLHIGSGGTKLVFAHATLRQARDYDLQDAMVSLQNAIRYGEAALTYSSDTETLSRLPSAQPYLDVEGGLLR